MQVDGIFTSDDVLKGTSVVRHCGYIYYCYLDLEVSLPKTLSKDSLIFFFLPQTTWKIENYPVAPVAIIFSRVVVGLGGGRLWRMASHSHLGEEKRQ